MSLTVNKSLSIYFMSHIKLQHIFSCGLLSGLLLTACSNNTSVNEETANLSADQSQSLHIAAAANLSSILPEIIELYKKEANLPNDYDIEVTYASSGKLYAQINSGAPYDLFLSANQSYPHKLADASLNGKKRHQPFTYARGQLAFYTNDSKCLDTASNPDSLKQIELNQNQLAHNTAFDINTFNQLIESYPNTKLTIANPELAPYGASAKAFLNKKNLYKKLTKDKRLVQAENIGQTFQYVHAGSVDYGLVAQSQLIALGISGSLYRTLNINEYPAILQDGIVITSNDSAENFAQFIQSDLAQNTFQQAGYLPITQPEK